MKNLKFSRLFAAVTFVAILALAGCKNQPEESSKAIEGSWVNANEKYEISSSEYKNYSQTKQKELTRFDGYDIEQAYEDGGKAVLEKIMQAIRDKKTGTRFGDVIDCIRELRGDD